MCMRFCYVPLSVHMLLLFPHDATIFTHCCQTSCVTFDEATELANKLSTFHHSKLEMRLDIQTRKRVVQLKEGYMYKEIQEHLVEEDTVCAKEMQHFVGIPHCRECKGVASLPLLPSISPLSAYCHSAFPLAQVHTYTIPSFHTSCSTHSAYSTPLHSTLYIAHVHKRAYKYTLRTSLH